MVAVGLGGIGSACPLQLAGGANCPLSCGEHCGGAGGQLEMVVARLMRALRLNLSEVVAGRRVADDIIRIGPITAKQLLCRPF